MFEQSAASPARAAALIPVAVSGWKAEVNTAHWTGWPTVGSPCVANPVREPDAIETLTNLTPVS